MIKHKMALCGERERGTGEDNPAEGGHSEAGDTRAGSDVSATKRRRESEDARHSPTPPTTYGTIAKHLVRHEMDTTRITQQHSCVLEKRWGVDATTSLQNIAPLSSSISRA